MPQLPCGNISDPNYPHTTTNTSTDYGSPRSSYLTTLMTRHTMRTAVSAHTTMTAFFRVGRCVMSDEIRDPTVASVALCARPSSLMTAVGVVEFRLVAGDECVCGSARTRQRTATAKVKARLCAPMMLQYGNVTKNVVSQVFTQVVETQKQLSYYRAAVNECPGLLFPR